MQSVKKPLFSNFLSYRHLQLFHEDNGMMTWAMIENGNKPEIM